MPEENKTETDFLEEKSFPLEGIIVRDSENKYVIMKESDITDILKVPKRYLSCVLS